MRGPISDVEDVPYVTPMPTSANVPGMLLDDELYMTVCAAIDELIAPLVVALDCLPAYLDAGVTPEDFLPWLGSLVGAPANRAAIRGAVPSYGLRGTPLGLRTLAAEAAGVALDAVQLDDPGSVTWSATTGAAAPPNTGVARLRVTVAKRGDRAAITAAVQAAIESSRPVHCVVQVEVVGP